MSLVHCYPDAALAAEACGAAILESLKTAIAQRGRATLAVSGGSSPQMMFEYFARAERDWNRVHIYWVDERCVPPDHSQSNYKLAWDAWLHPTAVPEGNVHRVPTELGLQEAARRYDAVLRAAGIFDVIHRGMGPDGHTASLFPGDPLIGDHQHYAAGVSKETPRITMLPAVLESARRTVVLATGADKRSMLDRVLHAPYDPMKYPAQIAALDAARAAWYVDRAAYPS
jgi:6-phosphogluconolactonase